MSECGVLAEHSTVSSHRVIPMALAVPSRRHLGREGEKTRTRTQPISSTIGGNGSVIRTFTFIASYRRSLSSAGALTPTSTPKDTGNYRRNLAGKRRMSPGTVHCRGFTLDRPIDAGIAESGHRANTDDRHVGGTDLSSDISTVLESPILSE